MTQAFNPAHSIRSYHTAHGKPGRFPDAESLLPNLNERRSPTRPTRIANHDHDSESGFAAPLRRRVSYHLNIHKRKVSARTPIMPIIPAHAVISTATNPGFTRPSPDTSKHLRVALAEISAGTKKRMPSGMRKRKNAKNDFANNGRKNGSG